MAKTHEQILESFEALLFDAITSLNKEKLRQLIDPNHVFVNETGETFQGIKKLEINKPEILRIQSIELQERKITLFNNVAIVNSVEMRTGDYRSLHFEREYSVTRVWKFSGRTWMLISTTVVLM